MDDSKESGWCAIRPTEGKDKVKDWGDRILQGDDDEIGGYADYLKNDPFTDEGLDAIAVFNDYKSKWDQVKDETGFYAVFSEQGSSASRLEAAKFLDAIAHFEGCDGEDSDAIGAYTQVVLDDMPESDKVLYLDLFASLTTSLLLAQN